MKIKASHINWLEVLRSIPKEGEGGEGVALLPAYLEYPKPDKELSYVMQWHFRGRSVHTDWRMEINDYLIGWTVLSPGGVPKNVETVKEGKQVAEKEGIPFNSKNKNIGMRAETKARQPKVWLTVEGIVKPGEVGATKEYPGVFIIVDKGKVYFGSQKPYFHEYFIKSEMKDGPFPSDDWTRIIARAVNVQVIDPETKKPRPGTELMWRVLVPSDQVPYCLKRGLQKKWIPPKDYIPIPPDWRKGDEYEKWYEWVKEAWKKGKTTKEEEALVKAKFTAQYLSYMGQIVVRGIPKQKWFLRLEEKGKIYSWESEIDFTKFSPVTLTYEGIVDDKWMAFEGDIPPNSKYNPTKTLTANMRIIDTGTATIDTKIEEGAIIKVIAFNGKILRGKYTIYQEEKESPIYTIEKLSVENLEQATFVLHLHEIETEQGLKAHWDIRIDKGFEFNVWGNPLDLTEEGERHKALYKLCPDIERWMAIEKPKTKMIVGPLTTWVTPIDKGKVILIEQNLPRFISILFEGEKLKGYFIYREEDGMGYFERTKLPHPLNEEAAIELKGTGDPTTGDYYKPFKEIRKQGWNYFWLEIYDQKEFSRCVENPERYIPELRNAPSEVLETLICLYPRPGTIHGARVSRVRFSDKWTVEQASDWIKKKKLHEWSGSLIKEERKSIKEETEPTEDEMLTKIIEEELKKREKTPEERQLELELKKKKLELIERWLEAQKE